MDHLLFRLSALLFALPLAEVEEVVRAVAVTPVPDVPETVLGIIDVRGHWRVVVDLRRRLGLAPARLAPSQRFVLIADEPAAFVVDAVDGLFVPCGAREAELPPGLTGYIKGAAEHQGEQVLLFDQESLFGGFGWREGLRRILEARADG